MHNRQGRYYRQVTAAKPTAASARSELCWAGGQRLFTEERPEPVKMIIIYTSIILKPAFSSSLAGKDWCFTDRI